jgi:hypothetical protein
VYNILVFFVGTSVYAMAGKHKGKNNDGNNNTVKNSVKNFVQLNFISLV